MPSRLEQHLLRAKSKAGNFELFALYSCYFLSAVRLPHGQLLALTEKTVSLTWYWSVHLGYQFLTIRWLKATQQGCVFSLNWVPTEFWAGKLPIWSRFLEPLSYSPQNGENTPPRFAPSFNKMWRYPQYPKRLYFDPGVAFRLVYYLIGCKI